jgi:hypothetical protein
MEDNLIELIQIHGADVYYIVRESEDVEDPIMGEDPRAKYRLSYYMEMLPQEFMGTDYMGKFGLQVPETQRFVVARKVFERMVPAEIAQRPREGDLIYMPVQHKLYEIKFCEEDTHVWSLGNPNPYVYTLSTELFKYGQEKIQTGVPEVDQIPDDAAYTVTLQLGNGSGNFIYSEQVYQGNSGSAATATGIVKDWNPDTKELQIIYITSNFLVSSNVKGNTSGANYAFTTQYNPLDDNVLYDDYANADFESQANSIIDRSEVNPFGRP